MNLATAQFVPVIVLGILAAIGLTVGVIRVVVSLFIRLSRG